MIPADGFYEWTLAEDGGKDPHCITLPDWEPFAFAGLWAHNEILDITSCTILTAPAVKEIAHLHSRMPIILNRENYDHWLDTETAVDDARELLNNTRGPEFVSYRVNRDVNSSRASGSKLIQAV